MKAPIKDRIVRGWFLSGLKDFFFAFNLDDYSWDYQPFICSIGFEKICKAYLLAMNSYKYENLNWQDAKKIVDCLARKWGHSLKKMVKQIERQTGDKEIAVRDHLLVLDAMEAAYFECRYPVVHYFHEKFPIKRPSRCL